MKNPFKDLLYFSRGERRGILVPIVGIIVIFLSGYIRSFRQNNRAFSDKKIQLQVVVLREYNRFINSMREQNKNAHNYSDGFLKHKKKTIMLAPFDPNHADSTAFCRLGLPPWMTENVLLHRSKGGKFRKTEDFKKAYGLTGERYRALAPCIYFTAEDTIKKTASLYHPVPPQENNIYKYPAGTALDLNNVGTIELKKIPGMRSDIARLIVGYQKRLGGFYKIEQLEEVHLSYRQLQAWFAVAPPEVRRINLNHADIERLCYYPYISFYQAEAFVEYHRKRGELHDLKLFAPYEEFTKSDLERFSHYVCFE